MHSYVTRRSLGYTGHMIRLKTKMNYSPLQCVAKYGEEFWSFPSTCSSEGYHGAIYNLEFSPDNKYLVAACENKDIAVFDPCIHRKVKTVSNAHRDSVNGVAFLDTRVFATCSDDTTIGIWDVRNLNTRVSSLVGHTNWVKNITFDPDSNLLISSAFDNTVRTWKINEFSSDSTVKGHKFIHIPFLTRTDLLRRDVNKFIIATTTGILLVIHNINFFLKSSFCNTEDLRKNNKTSNSNAMGGDKNEEDIALLKAPNRIEYIKNFPLGSKPWCIASLQTHPTNCNVLSRYTCKDSTEWSVVHNIRDLPCGDTMTSRLQAYTEEPNLASGLIKELCYSPDGRVICSPYGNGVRLLSYNTECDSFPEAPTGTPQELTELKYITSHKAPVLTARFANDLPIMASGCLRGQVSFYQPKW